jgi:membrane protein YdbS with pleckstrin-like domain
LQMVVERAFGADPELKRLYQVYIALVVFGGFLWWVIPVSAFAVMSWIDVGIIVALSLLVLLGFVFGFTLYWIPKFVGSISFVLDKDNVTVTKGVWWKTKSFVPYNRITNINIYQGPISRRFGLGKLSIQTAGFSGTSSGGGKVAEAVIFGIKNFEQVKDVVMKFVKGVKPEAVEAEVEGKLSETLNQQVLSELRKIRKLLEKSSPDQ